MRRLLLLAVPLLFMACSESKPDRAAALAACRYYNQLIAGNADSFVRGMELPDTIPDGYRRQLIDNALMFLEQQKREHGGISRVEVQNCINDSVAPTAQAFLLLCFGDSTVEEVVVPMVRRDGVWRMK